MTFRTASSLLFRLCNSQLRKGYQSQSASEGVETSGENSFKHKAYPKDKMHFLSHNGPHVNTPGLILGQNALIIP